MRLFGFRVSVHLWDPGYPGVRSWLACVLWYSSWTMDYIMSEVILKLDLPPRPRPVAAQYCLICIESMWDSMDMEVVIIQAYKCGTWGQLQKRCTSSTIQCINCKVFLLVT